MRKAFFLIIVVVFGIACSPPKSPANPRELIDADKAFSDYSLKNGIQKAFIEFAHDSLVKLKPNAMPIVGKQNLIASFAGKKDSGLVLTWAPSDAVMAKSGELGFTYGIWTLIAKGDTSRGTYLSVWKKDRAGHWKYIADTGNDGLAQPSR